MFSIDSYLSSSAYLKASIVAYLVSFLVTFPASLSLLWASYWRIWKNLFW